MAYFLFYTYDVADPVKFLTEGTGIWAVIFMVLTLAVTPLRQLTGKQWLFPYRAIFGRMFFIYVLAHAMVFFALANTFNMTDIIISIKKSKPVIFGLTAFVLLLPMIFTTGKFMIKKLGAKKWKRVHSLIYPVSILGILHYATVVKKDIREPVFYGVMVLVLLLYRVYKSKKKTA